MSSNEPRMVKCVALGKEMPGLEVAPFPGELGEQILKHVSAEAWRRWEQEMQVRILNEYRLNMGDNGDYFTILREMCNYFNLEQPTFLQSQTLE